MKLDTATHPDDLGSAIADLGGRRAERCRTSSALQLLGATIADGMIALTVILAMSFGVILPKIAIDHLTASRLAGRGG